MTAAERSIVPLLFAVAVYGLVVSRGAALLLDGDTYWHIATGHWILQHFAVPRHDPFSFTAAGTPWVDHEWLGEAVIALAYDLGGWNALVLLTALAVALSLGLLCRFLGRWLAALPALVLALLAYLMLLPSLLCRPHVIALPMLVVWTAALANARSEARPPHWIMVPFMVLWANLHGSFPAGLAMAVPLGIEAVLAAPAGRRRMVAIAWSQFVLACILAACLTPNLRRGLFHPLYMMQMPVMLAAITEWRSPDFQHLQPLELWLVAALYFGLTRGVRLPPMRMLLMLGLLHAGLQHARNQILLGFVGPLIVAEPLQRYLQPGSGLAAVILQRFARPARGAAAAAAALLSGLALLHPIVRADDKVTPRAALAHVPRMLAAEPVLNDYDFGGYLIFRGLRPYIDGRADMYGDRFLAAYLDLLRPDKPKLEAALRDHAIAWTLLKPDDGAVALLDALPGWERLYADEVAVVHVRSIVEARDDVAGSSAAP